MHSTRLRSAQQLFVNLRRTVPDLLSDRKG